MAMLSIGLKLNETKARPNPNLTETKSLSPGSMIIRTAFHVKAGKPRFKEGSSLSRNNDKSPSSVQAPKIEARSTS